MASDSSSIRVQHQDGGQSLAEQFLNQHPAVRYVRLHWVDYSGVLRARFVPKERFLHMASGTDGYSLAQNCMIIPVATAPECWPPGPELWGLHPDVASLRVCGFNEKHAAVMCSISHEDIADKFSKCPRSLAQQVVRDLESEHQVQLLVGFELEFVLLDSNLELTKPLDEIAGYSMTAGLRGPLLSIMEEIGESLEKSGIGIHHFHTEIANQLEIALPPLPPVEAIDTLMLAQETIRTVFVRHGLKATMSPRPLLGVPGPQNGCHMHLSLNGASLKLSDSFIAGILSKLQAICAFGMATYESYARVVEDGCGLWIGWGTENRDLPIRKVGKGHWEFRFLDATANAYLALAATLSAGLDGIREGKPLAFKDCSVFLHELTPMQLAEYGIKDKMPTSLRETLDAAQVDPEVKRWMGEELLAKYSNVKDKEIEAFSKMSDEQRREKYLTFF